MVPDEADQGAGCLDVRTQFYLGPHQHRLGGQPLLTEPVPLGIRELTPDTRQSRPLPQAEGIPPVVRGLLQMAGVMGVLGSGEQPVEYAEVDVVLADVEPVTAPQGLQDGRHALADGTQNLAQTVHIGAQRAGRRNRCASPPPPRR